MTAPIRIASRSSKLALWQANTIGKMLNCEYEIVKISTSGDVRKDVPIVELGGIGAFAKEVQSAVLNNVADIAVHSAKDLTSITPEGLDLCAIPLRGDVRDVLIGSTLQDLAYGARVGTGAGRRRAQLAMIRPDLRFEELRGNIETRISKAENFDAIVLAYAALNRLELDDYATQILDVGIMLPQVGQGALAVEVREDDEITKQLVLAINDLDSYRCVMAERAFLRTLGGGCTIPCGAYGVSIDSKTLYLRAMLAEPTGRQSIFVEAQGEDPDALGVALARELLDEKGGDELMELVI